MMRYRCQLSDTEIVFDAENDRYLVGLRGEPAALIVRTEDLTAALSLFRAVAEDGLSYILPKNPKIDAPSGPMIVQRNAVSMLGMEFDGQNGNDILCFVNTDEVIARVIHAKDEHFVLLTTGMKAYPKDWIVKDAKGNVLAVEKDQFERDYRIIYEH